MIKTKRFLLIYLAVLLPVVACSLGQLADQARDTQQTAQAVLTQAESLATQSGPLLETARAAVTQIPGYIQTAQVIATRGAPVLATLKAVATEHPGIMETAVALATHGFGVGEPPSDIPLLEESQMQNYFATEQLVTYYTALDYPTVLDMYKTQMPANGWQPIPEETHEYANAATLTYTKEGRTAVINLSFSTMNYTTVVVINIYYP